MNSYLTLKVVSICRTEEILIVTRKMLRERAVVLASHDGRAPHEACKTDWEQAKVEMYGTQNTHHYLEPLVSLCMRACPRKGCGDVFPYDKSACLRVAHYL